MRSIVFYVLFLCAAGLASAAAAGAVPIQPGHSALWYDPARNGEGWVLEILSDNRALLYWFTYDEQGNQRWLQGVGAIVSAKAGDAIEFSELYVARGGRFGPSFDPGEVEIEVVGEAALTFTDCDLGTFSYSAFGQSQTIEIERLTQTMAAGCAPIHGIPGEPVREYAGQSGSWFDLTHNGEGFSLQWLSRDEAVLIWYSYDSEGNQYWMIGVGHYQDGQIVFPTLNATRGARFGTAFDPADVDLIVWGSLVMELDCSVGAASYESTLAEFGSGGFDLTRLTRLKQPNCPWIAPQLTDLYEITWNEIPIALGTPMDPNSIQVESIADDGTIAARKVNSGDGQLALWHPETGEWEIIPREIATLSVFISPDGSAVVATDPIAPSGERIDPIIWRNNTGWQPLPGLNFDRSVVTGVSQDLTRVLGRGSRFGSLLEYPWIWDVESGQQQLPLTEQITGGTPLAVSNDGKSVVGVTFRPPPEGFTGLVQGAIRWENGDDPEVMVDDLGVELRFAGSCNDDCSIVFGSGQAVFDPDHPRAGEAWFWRSFGGAGYLDGVDDAVQAEVTYNVTDVTADGSLAVGGYSTLIDELGGPNPTVRGFIWTQRTGMVSVRTLIDELGIGDDDWETMSAQSVSSSGDKILLGGRFVKDDQFELARWRAVILELTMKEGSD